MACRVLIEGLQPDGLSTRARPSLTFTGIQCSALPEAVPLRRVRAGNWLGPSGLCNTLEAIVNHVQPAGLQCRVVASSGGGAPVLCTSRYSPGPFPKERCRHHLQSLCTAQRLNTITCRHLCIPVMRAWQPWSDGASSQLHAQRDCQAPIDEMGFIRRLAT